MLFERQRLLLTLLDALGGKSAKTDFQKLLFLYTRLEATPSYEFVPYKFGCFSFTSYADKRKLVERGLLVQDDNHWELTEEGQRIARKEAVAPLFVGRFCRDHAGLRGTSLVAKVYRLDPYYAIRSEILDKVLTDASERDRVEKARPAKAKSGIFTIGYEGKCLEKYLNQLMRSGVTLLCDVRRNPMSRKYGFAKSTLSHACEGVGIRYEHLPALGIASEERRQLNSQSDYDALFEDYEQKSLPLQSEPLSRISDWLTEGESVALTCFELLPHQCHRHCVAEAIERDFKGQLKAKHL